jgi:hypothetical protein
MPDLAESAKRVAASLIVVVVVAGFYLVSATIQSLYHGPLYFPTAFSTSGFADGVNDCSRSSVISRFGGGRWWICTSMVTLQDGRHVTVRIGPSVLTPEDSQKHVQIVETCTGRNGSGSCSYTREGSTLLGIVMRGLMIVRWSVVIIGVLLTVILLLRTLFDLVASVILNKVGVGGHGEMR